MELNDKLLRFDAKTLLSSNTGDISKVFEGTVDGSPAILTLHKVAFSEEYTSPGAHEVIHENDVYTSGTFVATEMIKYSLIHPATETQIKKYRRSEYVLVKETAEMYRTKTLPHALKHSPNCKWIDTIFQQADGCATPCITESKEHVLFMDKEFLICPDLKWDRVTLESLYLLVLFKDPNIYTLRELRQEHIPLLERIQQAAVEALAMHNYTTDKVKIYFHYYPTFYRAHVHISSISSSWPGTSIGKSVLLNDVIEGLKVSSTYFQDKTMEVCISKESYMYSIYSE
ncbi:m7GpppX diphosphatase [Nematocida ausubeli]|nr:m7GpppX diphosphatase [Nematocida ausubeli]